MNSESVSNFWPDSLRKKTKKYFNIRSTINDLMEIKDLRSSHPILNIHECFTNPLLENYILWAFGSDKKAQDIVLKFLNQKKTESDDIIYIYLYLAADAAQKKDYLQSEKYLQMYTNKMGLKNTDPGIFRRRIYLLFISGDHKKAGETGNEYINFSELNKTERKKQVDSYWQWLVKIFNK